MVERLNRGRGLRSPMLWLYLVVPVLYCVWVLSMPVFPSTDGPMHLYLAEIFRQLLGHVPGVYAQTFYVKHYLPPYSVYYYWLAGAGSVVGMEMADKLMVCGVFLVLAMGVRSLCRALSGEGEWAPFLALPVLINWPLMMGFVNYSLGTGFACFAMAIWCRNAGRPGVGRRLAYVGMLVLILLTHPVPWMFAVGFALFDLGLRLVRSGWERRRGANGAKGALAFFGLDLGAALVGCLGYFYLKLFQNAPMAPDPSDPVEASQTFWQGVGYRAADYLKTRGLTVFSGTHGMAAVYRLLLCGLFVAALGVGVWHTRKVLRRGQWTVMETWVTFAAVFLVAMPFIPASLNGSFFFAWRLMVLLYLTAALAAAGGVRACPRLGMGLGLAGAVTSLVALGLAVRYVSPMARDIATLREAPVVESAKPGMMIRLTGGYNPEGLTYDPLISAGANYFRWHDQLMFNTSWVNLSIIPVQPRADALPMLDERYIINTPVLGRSLMQTPEEARQTLARVGFVVALPARNLPAEQNPFAVTIGGTEQPAYAAGWRCTEHGTWDLCAPGRVP